MLSGRWSLTVAMVVPLNEEHCCYYMVSVRHVVRKGVVPDRDGKKMQISVVVLAQAANSRIVEIVVGHIVGKMEIDCIGWDTWDN